MTGGPETLEVSHDVLEMSPEARAAEVEMLEEWWRYEMPPGGGGGGGFPPNDDEKKYGGDRPEPEEPSRRSWRDLARFMGRAMFGGHLGSRAYSSSHAVPDTSGTVPGGFRIHNKADAHVHQWEATNNGPMPDSWIESSPRRQG